MRATLIYLVRQPRILPLDAAPRAPPGAHFSPFESLRRVIPSNAQALIINLAITLLLRARRWLMTGLTATHPKELMTRHLEVLREYAGRALNQQDELSPAENEDKTQRIEELLAVGSSFGLTKKEITSLLYRWLFVRKRGCDCMVCQARRSNVGG